MVKLAATEKKGGNIVSVFCENNFFKSLDIVQPNGIPVQFVLISQFGSLNGRDSCPLKVNRSPIFQPKGLEYIVMTKIEGINDVSTCIY